MRTAAVLWLVLGGIAVTTIGFLATGPSRSAETASSSGGASHPRHIGAPRVGAAAVAGPGRADGRP